MDMQRRALVVAVLLVAAGLMAAGPAAACSMVGPRPTEAELLATAEVVFEGTAVGRHDPSAGNPTVSSGDPIVWTFAVDRPVKGATGLRQEVQSARSGVSCGIEFVLGTRYRVYAARAGDVLTTAAWSGTRVAPADTVAPTVTTAPSPPAAPAPPATASRPRRIALTG